MRILFVSSGNKQTGISTIVKSLGTSLQGEGLEIVYFRIAGKGMGAYLRSVFRLRGELNRSSYDLIHAHYGLCGIVSWLARRNEKLVVSFMGSDLLGSDLSKGFHRIFFRALETIYRWMARNYLSHSLVKSRSLGSRLKATRNVTVCPSGVSMDKFYPVAKTEAMQMTGFEPGKAHVIFVADPSRPEKNHSLAKKAAALVPELTLHTIYNLDQEQLRYYYSSADALLLTSDYEGSPNVVKEAMACNCPVVSTDVGDVRELFGNCEGCFISSNDLAQIAADISSAIGYRKNYGETSGRQRITELGLDERTIAKKIADIYKVILR